MSPPRRIQLRRAKGWRKPEGAVYVARPGKWGNPIKVPKHLRRDPVFLAGVVAAFRAGVLSPERTGIWKNYPPIAEIATLRGKDLTCWCTLNLPCHADVLLEQANS